MNFGFRRIILSIIILAAMLFLSHCSSWQKVTNPNLIVIIIDTLRPDHLSCYGYSKIRTEYIDRIAKEGMIFNEAVCQVPLTFPSHCSIFTGRYPTAHGVRHNGLFKLAQSESTLAEVLKKNGFETAAFIGSYVLNSGFGLEQGFDTYNDIKVNLKNAKDQESVQEITGPERVAEEVNAEFFRWIETVKGKRFFAWVHYYDPHFPYAPPASTSKKIEGVGYDREVSYSDQCIGDLMEKLRELRILENSIVLFASDHGEALGEHGETAHGVFIYDCTIKIPLILRAPWIVKGGSRYKGLFETVDIVPTLLGLLKIEIPPPVQGKNFASEIEKGDYRAGKTESYAETYMPLFEYGWSELKSLRKGEKKYIEAPIPELYNIAQDPSELANMFNSSDQECVEMKAELARLIPKISTGEADPYKIGTLDEANIKILKSLGYLSGDYFKGGKIKAGQDRADPKLTVEEENLVTNGKNLMGAGKFDDAIALFEKVLQKNPKNYQARIFILKVLVAKEDFKGAMEHAKEAVRIAELDATALIAFGSELWNMYGHLLEREKDEQGAIKAYMKGFEINPNDKIAFTFPTTFYITRKNYDKALEIVSRVLESNPEHVLANSYLFKLYVEKKRTEDAVRVAKKLVHYDMSDDPQTLILAGQVLHRHKMLPEAASAYEQVLKILPKEKAVAGMLGRVHMAMKETRKAREYFEYMLSLDPNEFGAHFYLGLLDLQKNDEQSARNRFQKVISLNPNYYAVYDALGGWLKDKGRLDEARGEFKKALTLNPEDPIAFEALKSLK